jgi:OOP family OmpA-OmpF porin
MKNTTWSIVLVAATGIYGSNAATAQGYFGASVGESTIDVCDDFYYEFGATSCDDNDTGWKLFGGIELNQFIALEGGWADFGEATASAGPVDIKLEGKGFTLDGKVSAPLTDVISVFARLGVVFWEADLSVPGFGTASEDGNDVRYGFGAELNLSPQSALRAEWERNEFDDVDVDLLSVGAVLKF